MILTVNRTYCIILLGQEGYPQQWNEVYIKQTLYLYLSILPDSPSYTERLVIVEYH